mmetsp:Transcript_32729/g.89611  ORF Transcript_32729/g.89611 Transcript_32729/m.89611 type:complete len:263 (-) Transcript_32729:228-1016(-)
MPLADGCPAGDLHKLLVVAALAQHVEECGAPRSAAIAHEHGAVPAAKRLDTAAGECLAGRSEVEQVGCHEHVAARQWLGALDIKDCRLHLQWPADLARRRPRGRVQQRERLLAVVGRQSARAAGGGREGAEAGARAQFHDASAAKCRERRELTRDDLCGRPEHDAVWILRGGRRRRVERGLDQVGLARHVGLDEGEAQILRELDAQRDGAFASRDHGRRSERAGTERSCTGQQQEERRGEERHSTGSQAAQLLRTNFDLSCW